MLIQGKHIIQLPYRPFRTQLALQVRRKLKVVDKWPPLPYRSQGVTIVELYYVPTANWSGDPVAAKETREYVVQLCEMR